jgi:acyl transferase domain-containing protein
MLHPAAKPEPSLQTAFKALGQVWSAGIIPDWDSFYAAEIRHRIPLPGYPFERVRHWVEPPAGWAGHDTAQVNPLAAKSADTQETVVESAVVDDAATGDDHLSQIRARLKKALLAVTGIEVAQTDEESTFLELGFDSLLLTQISAKVRQEFGVSLKFQELIEDYDSIISLSSYLAACVPPTKTVSVSNDVKLPEPVATETKAITPVQQQSTSSNEDISRLENMIVQQTEVIEQVLGMLRENQFVGTGSLLKASGTGKLAKSNTVFNPQLDASNPPIPEARLGRDPDGNPGWYVPDPNQPGKYMLLSN